MADAHGIILVLFRPSLVLTASTRQPQPNARRGAPSVKMPVAGVFCLLMPKVQRKTNGADRMPKGEQSRARYAKDVG